MASPGAGIGQSGVAKRRRELLHSRSVQQHREHFDAIIKGSMESMSDSLETLAGSTMKDISQGRDLALEMLMNNFAHELQRRTDRFVHMAIDSAWRTFDKNKDGSLQPNELRPLVKGLFQSLEKDVEGLVMASLQPAVDNLHDWIENDSTGPIGFAKGSGGMHIALEVNTQARVAGAGKKLASLLCLMLQGLQKSSDELSDEIFAMCDENKDGKLSKSEFLEEFGEAFGAIVDFSRIVKQFLRDRPRRAAGRELGRQGTLLSGDDMPAVNLVLALGVVALLGGLAYRMVRDRR